MSSRARARLATATFSTVPEEPNPQKYGMEAVANLSDGVTRGSNAHEGVEPCLNPSR